MAWYIPLSLMPGTLSDSSPPPPEQGSIDDIGLMERVARGDRDALTKLYDRHKGVLLAICLRIVKDRGEAEQVLLDLFLTLWRHPERFDVSRGSPQVYLVMVARSRAIDCRRRLDRRNVRPLEITSDPAASVQGDQLDALVSDEQGRLVRAAVSALDEKQREAVELAFFEGLSHSEIASRLNKPLGTVKTFIRSGLIRLRDTIRINKGVDSIP